MSDDNAPEQLKNLVLYAWVGPNDALDAKDDAWGLKQGIVPAGCIPLVAVNCRIEKLWPEMKGWAKSTGKVRYLARFEFAGVVRVEKP